MTWVRFHPCLGRVNLCLTRPWHGSMMEPFITDSNHDTSSGITDNTIANTSPETHFICTCCISIMSKAIQGDGQLNINRHLRVVGVVVEDRMIRNSKDKIIKAGGWNAKVRAKDIGEISFVLIEKQLEVDISFRDWVSLYLVVMARNLSQGTDNSRGNAIRCRTRVRRAIRGVRVTARGRTWLRVHLQVIGVAVAIVRDNELSDVCLDELLNDLLVLRCTWHGVRESPELYPIWYIKFKLSRNWIDSQLGVQVLSKLNRLSPRSSRLNRPFRNDRFVNFVFP